MESRSRRSDLVLYLIAAFKLVKATLLFLVGAGALRLARDGDAEGELVRWIEALNLDPGNRHIHRVLAVLGAASEKRLREIGAGTFVYAAVFLVEGVGLALRRPWAERLTVLVTLSFVPIELYELFRRPTAPRALSIPVNLAVVAYLVARLASERRQAVSS